jgi:hypothetical protein
MGLKANERMEKIDSTQLKISGFLDVFYVYDFRKPTTSTRQSFLYNHNRHNEFNVNLGLLQLNVENSTYRANLALQTGTYANDNYAAEPGLLKNIFEANVGIALNRNNNLWLDAGVLPSHIGFESAISTENPTLTRSLSAENSPYFLTGAKLNYTGLENWDFSVLITNGWQRIQRQAGNSLPAFGSQIAYTTTKGNSLNWSTFIGTDDPDSTRRMRYFSNLYGHFSIGKRLSIFAGFDIGLQQQTKNSSTYNLWYAPTFIGQYHINEQWKTAVRVEHYKDNAGVMVTTPPEPGVLPPSFIPYGASINIDYSPTSAVVCRLEGRYLTTLSNIDPFQNHLIIGGSMAVNINQVLGK